MEPEESEVVASSNALRSGMNTRFRQIDDWFTEMHARLDAVAAGQQQIVDLIQRLIDQRGEPDRPRRSES